MRTVLLTTLMLLTGVSCGPTPLTIMQSFADSPARLPKVFDIDCSSKIRFAFRRVKPGLYLLSSSVPLNVSVGSCVYGTTTAVKISFTKEELIIFECPESDYTSKALIYVGNP